jgi:hypothetical protein
MASHKSERLPDLGLWHDGQEWRLVEVHGESLLQPTVEHWVAGGVGEVGKHNRVFSVSFAGRVDRK